MRQRHWQRPARGMPSRAFRVRHGVRVRHGPPELLVTADAGSCAGAPAWPRLRVTSRHHPSHGQVDRRQFQQALSQHILPLLAPSRRSVPAASHRHDSDSHSSHDDDSDPEPAPETARAPVTFKFKFNGTELRLELTVTVTVPLSGCSGCSCSVTGIPAARVPRAAAVAAPARRRTRS